MKKPDSRAFFISVLIAALAAIMMVPGRTWAQTTQREKALEERVKYLEQRLARIEARLRVAPEKSHVASALTTPPTVTPPAVPVVAATPPKLVAQTPTPQTPAPTPQAPTPQAPTPQAPTPQAPTPQAPTPQASTDSTDESAPQELNILRENAVTLKPTGFELSSEFDYARRESTLQSDRAYTNTTTLRYGVLDWLELSATVPTGYSARSTQLAAAAVVTGYASGIGDVSAQANARVFRETAAWPGVVVSLGFVAPTGPNPYDLGEFTAQALANGLNPRNPLVDYFSLGTWALHSNLQIYKTVDPLILFVGFGYDRVFPLSASRFTVDGFNRLSYNLGMSFALSEKTTLGFSVSGNYTPNIAVNGHEIIQTAEEPTLARFTIIQRLQRNLWLEPSASFGMDQDAPNFVLGLGLRARF
jgi:hypothetical protein